jgi:hypothetical protein
MMMVVREERRLCGDSGVYLSTRQRFVYWLCGFVYMLEHESGRMCRGAVRVIDEFAKHNMRPVH